MKKLIFLSFLILSFFQLHPNMAGQQYQKTVKSPYNNIGTDDINFIAQKSLQNNVTRIFARIKSTNAILQINVHPNLGISGNISENGVLIRDLGAEEIRAFYSYLITTKH